MFALVVIGDKTPRVAALTGRPRLVVWPSDTLAGTSNLVQCRAFLTEDRAVINSLRCSASHTPYKRISPSGC